MLQRMVHDKEVTFCMLSAKNIKCNQLLLGMHPMICYFIFCLAFIRSVCVCVYCCSSALVGLDLIVVQLSISHSDTSQSIGLLWTSDQPVSGTLPENTQHLQQTDIHTHAGFETAITASELPQTHAFDRAATGIGM